MSANSPTINNAQSSNWIAHIPGYEDLTFKITKFSIPEVTAGTTSIGNATEMIMQESGDHIQYADLILYFLVDENFHNYRKLYRWMRSNTRKAQADTTSLFIHLTNNNKDFQGVELEFLDVFPVSLDEVDFDSDGNTTDVTCAVTFKYTGFDFVDETERDTDVT